MGVRIISYNPIPEWGIIRNVKHFYRKKYLTEKKNNNEYLTPFDEKMSYGKIMPKQK